MKNRSIKPNDYKIHSKEVRSLVEILQQLFTGDETEEQLFNQIRDLLSDLDFNHTHTEYAYISFITLLLQAVMSQLPNNADVQEQLALLQAQLEPPLDLDSVDIIYQCVQAVAEQLQQVGVLTLEQASMILSPVLMEYANAKQQAQKPRTARESTAGKSPAPQRRSLLREQTLDADEDVADLHVRFDEDRATHPKPFSGAGKVGQTEAAAAQPPSSFRQRRVLGSDRRSKTSAMDTLANGEEQKNYRQAIQTLQKDFVRQTRKAVAQIASFGEQLELEIEAIKAVDVINDIDNYRRRVINTLERLQLQHNHLADSFDTARIYLSVVESGSQQLMDELDRVRLLSLTDELTGLPNRRAFLRRLQHEVSRVKRYRNPITLVIIDLDHFKAINDKYGHDAGDEVLKVYTEKVFSLFRHHDSVARYGGEEFVMLFPNTNLPGVLKALDKSQEKVKTITVRSQDAEFPLPSFSAGVVEYQRGESPEHFIARADKELYRAKRGGRGRVEYEPGDSAMRESLSGLDDII